MFSSHSSAAMSPLHGLYGSLKAELMLWSFSVNHALSANLASHFVDWSLGSCVLMRVVVVLRQAACSLWSVSLSYSWLPVISNLLTLQKWPFLKRGQRWNQCIPSGYSHEGRDAGSKGGKMKRVNPHYVSANKELPLSALPFYCCRALIHQKRPL